MHFLRQLLALCLMVCIAVSCSDNTTNPKHSDEGTLKVTTKTTGKSGETNYVVYLEDAEFQTPIGSSGTIYLHPVKEGVHSLKLLHIPPNCSSNGANPRNIKITAGDTTSTHFVIKCKQSLPGVETAIQESINNGAFPGAAVAIGHDSTIYMGGYGHYTYSSSSPSITPKTRFDLASLTKVIATTTAVMLLYDQGRISLDQKVSKYLPAFAQNGKGAVTIRELLSHSSGLAPGISLSGLSTRQQVINRILAQPLTYQTGSKSVYSDLNFIVLMLVVHEITGQNFADYCEAHIFQPLDMKNTGFMTDNYNHSLFAPTATNLQGVVNDPTARLMGGVSGNAGLYSTAEDLAKFGEMYLQHGMVNGKRFLKASTINLFTQYAGVPHSKRALGWMIMARASQGWCSCGKYFGSQSYGHRGYTGTCIWIDPEKDLFGFLLPNGTYPSGADDIPTIVAARKGFYNQIYELLILR